MAHIRLDFSAGGLVLRNGHVLLIQPAGGDAKWTFPKGHIERGEDEWDAALREVQEETGYACRIVRELPPTSYWYRDRGQMVKKTVLWFEMEPVGRNGLHDDEVARILWVPLKEALARLTYPTDRELLDKLVSDQGTPQVVSAGDAEGAS